MCTALTAPIDGGKVAPRFDGVTVVADASMYTCMARVQRVVIGAQAVLADGGFIGVAGTYSLCLAAHKFAVPVTCVSWHCVPIIDR
jgi:translation initiation factor 2B subunit (eIF-2B alpha/beta/delta family)